MSNVENIDGMDGGEEELTPSSGYFKKVRKDDEVEAPSLWLITFTDIMALMLTFFVLLYSMSVPTEEEWKEITKGLNNQFTKTNSAQWHRGAREEVNISKIDFSQAQNLTYLNSVLSNIVEKDERLKNIVIIPQRDHLIISVPEELLFASGQADINQGGKQVLFALGNTMARIRNRIEVIGHTDPTPIERAREQFGSNWELSLARAGSVANVLANAGYERPIVIRGFSSSRYDDLPEEMNEEERLSLSRRVDIVVEKDDGSNRKLLQIEGGPEIDILSPN
ncbi:MAG: flagellar motor protein MotB [Pseudomonadota bacterium]